MGTIVRVAALKKVLFPAFGFPTIPTCTLLPRGNQVFEGRPVILNPALLTPYRMFNETKSAVSCSIVLELFKGPASMPRTPGIALARSSTVFFASTSSPQTRTSQSTCLDMSFNDSALMLLNAETSFVPFGRNLAVNSPADPSQTPTVRVGEPPTAVSRGTVTLTTICPGLMEDFSDLIVSGSAAKGTATTRMSAFDATSGLTRP